MSEKLCFSVKCRKFKVKLLLRLRYIPLYSVVWMGGEISPFLLFAICPRETSNERRPPLEDRFQRDLHLHCLLHFRQSHFSSISVLFEKSIDCGKTFFQYLNFSKESRPSYMSEVNGYTFVANDPLTWYCTWVVLCVQTRIKLLRYKRSVCV